MAKYARGDRAYGECAKSGRRMLLNDMVEDGWSGLLVDPAWKEPPPRVEKTFEDGIALRRPTGDRDKTMILTEFFFGGVVLLSTGDPLPSFIGYGYCKPPTVSAT